MPPLREVQAAVYLGVDSGLPFACAPVNNVNPTFNFPDAIRVTAGVATRAGAATPPLMMELGKELLNAGRTTDAIAQFDRIEGLARAQRLDQRMKAWADLRMQHAIAQLRLGEEENCMLHHNARSCLFPIRGAGVHMQTRGSSAAVAILTDLLEHNPDNLAARWLLNVAGMTLGEYPDGVPARWRLAPELFDSEYDIKPFPDVAADLGMDVDDYAGGSIIEVADRPLYEKIRNLPRAFEEAMDDDFNTAEALAVLQTLTRELNTAKDAGKTERAALLGAELRALGAALDRLGVALARFGLGANAVTLLGFAFGNGLGKLEVGAPADLVVFDRAATWTVEPAALASRGKNTPLAGRELKGRVLVTVAGGRLAYEAAN
jgi:tetratricopeptide (TPR) repeat protein